MAFAYFVITGLCKDLLLPKRRHLLVD